MHHTVVERELELRLILSPERSIPVPARLGYRSDDPFAVHVAFHINSEHPVAWTFARELLVEGVFRPCGHGDVRVWPTKAEGRSVVLMALSSPDGDALLEAPAAQVSAWLERTLRVVPPGSEAEQLGIDDALAELLAPSPRLSPSREQAGPAPADDAWLRDPWPGDETEDAGE
ncbi:SsgA family sporulation/cell division regulator [Streptomyces sp. IBSBF 2953]|uniref:SsgA family sporulation/cell division regulator n=1 Tax=Streptomyces TaxID=1883 RepID=UPI002119D181|nr:SsgA family sporulation/cell division regulator [Streptomyces scabiei]MCQ9182319.1 SsgA family sporulation/cell division regulator [Streptomyces hayashii]MDX3117108.1 SsgA family sporulation/cell division regulator [Streptomyces scabiei]